jgi:hypothetical protein
VSWKLHPTRIRPLGSAPVSSFIEVLAARLKDIEQDIDLLRTRRQWLFDEVATHGYDKATVRAKAAAMTAALPSPPVAEETK